MKESGAGISRFQHYESYHGGKQVMTSEHFKFSPDILRRLGEELIPNTDQGVVELVRNSYDADAVNCSVELTGTDKTGGSLKIIDDGVGMDYEAVSSGWLVLGRSTKTKRRITPLGRRPVGEKGLGRLAALRLGSEVTLTTRPKSEPGTEYRLTIDWTRYEGTTVVEEVPLEINKSPTGEGHGTTIEVKDLASAFDRTEVERLARSLVLLADPFSDQLGFHPVLVSPEFIDLEKKVQNAYFEDAAWHLVAELDSQGRAKARVFDPRTGSVRWTANHSDLSKDIYRTAPAKFEFWVFLMQRGRFSNRSVTLDEVKSWLDVVGGVHFYHRGLRVHPYGDKGHDWLDINLLRTRNPEERPSTNTSLGRVSVIDPNQILTEKTDRTGFLEDEGFTSLRRFATDSLEWMARQRLIERDSRKRASKSRVSNNVARAQNNLGNAVSTLPADDRDSVAAAIKQLESARKRQEKILREDLQLYRTLASLGTTIAVFAHEASKPVDQIEKMAESIARRSKKALGPQYSKLLEKPIAVIQRSAKALRSYAAFPLNLLTKEKRQLGEVDIHAVISDMVTLFEPFLDDAKINCELRLYDGQPKVWGSTAAIESILSNLITNAVNAFIQQEIAPSDRKLVIQTDLAIGNLLLSVMDNGPGIIDLPPDEIWLPGRSSVPGGTGLGLTIVRDAVTDLGGQAQVIPQGELGGAEFIITLPILGVDR